MQIRANLRNGAYGQPVWMIRDMRPLVLLAVGEARHAVTVTQPFSQTMAVWALQESVEGFLDGKTVIQSYGDHRSRWDQWRSSMQTATSIDDLFNNVVGPE